MRRHLFRRAGVAAIAALVLSTVGAYADTVPADGDTVTAGNQTMIDLGEAAPGEVLTLPVTFRLTCAGSSRAALGSTIQLDLMTANVPSGGLATATATTIGPVPDYWTWGGFGCPFPAPTVTSNAPSVVTLTMPTTPGNDYQFALIWSRTGTSGLTGGTAITYQVDVIGNTPPTLHLPAAVEAEATSPAGAAVTWSATATDAEDATPPTPTCTPASGSTFPLGDTTVDCSVADDGGLKDSGSFVVSVVDTSAPRLVGMPGDKSLTTGDPTGTTLTYKPPTATDAADPDPSVSCDLASGSHVPVGTTVVTCTARDASGRHASASFEVSVTFVDPVAWSATWGEPVGSGNALFVANPGRTVPVKVQIFANGAEQTHGTATLSIAACGGGGADAMSVPLSWGGGRWNANLDTSALGGPGCYLVTAVLDGHAAGSFRIDLRGAEGSTSSKGPKTPKPTGKP